MNKFILFFLLLVLSPSAIAGDKDILPTAVGTLLKKYKLRQAKTGIVIQRLDTEEILVSHGADLLLNPASVTKLATAAAALDLLGPTHHFKTKFMTNGRIKKGVLEGDLFIVGGGDPYITIERFLLFINGLRNRGIQEIRGDLVVDDFYFDLDAHDPAVFDGAPQKPYNAGGGAFMVNFQTQRVVLLPQEGAIHAYTEPPNANFIVRNKIVPGKGRCRNWRSKIREILQGNETRMTLTLKGTFPPRCKEQGFFIRVLERNAHAAGIFTAFWQRLGGQWSGQWRRGKAPEEATEIAVLKSPPVSEIVIGMNKYSNNIIARNLFLSLSAANANPPYSLPQARQTMNDWLAKIGIDSKDLVIDNGSGLSRQTRITASQTAAILRYVWNHPLRAELAASLPILGLDGTMRKRLKRIAGEGRFKTGSLTGVKAIAGFLRDAAGREMLIVCITNQSGGIRVRSFQDALIKWARKQ